MLLLPLALISCSAPLDFAPVADAGPDRVMAVGAAAWFDGSGSFDPDGVVDAWAWSLLSAPSEGAVFESAGSEARLELDAPGLWVVGLRVTDNDGRSSLQDMVVITAIEGGQGGADPSPLARPAITGLMGPGGVLVLDGSASTSPAGTELLFDGEIVSAPLGSAARLEGQDGGPFAVFTPDLVGFYVLGQVVEDDSGASARGDAEVHVASVINQAPVAVCQHGVAVDVDQEVTLDGSASYDAESETVEHAWRLLSTPTDSLVDRDDTYAQRLTFRPDLEGVYRFGLVVDDGVLSSELCEVVVTAGVPDGGNPPLADAGPDRFGEVGQTVELLGGGSFDPEGGSLSAGCDLLDLPAGSSLGSGDLLVEGLDVRFVPDVPGRYVLRFEVCDAEGLCDQDLAWVEAQQSGNRPPIADPGPDLSVILGDTVLLDASNSFDPDGDVLSYAWSFGGKPAGSTLKAKDIADRKTASASFVPDLAGQYKLWLVVDDGEFTDNATLVVDVAAGAVQP